mgnify:CR=1 FL=1
MELGKESRKKEDKENEIPEMQLDTKYSDKKIALPESPGSEKAQKNVDKIKKEIEKIKSFILKKYPFTEAIGILPPNSLKSFIEDEVGENLT